MTAMSFQFHHLATLSSLLFFGLAATWMFRPSAMLRSWGVDINGSAGLVGRRAAALYAGMGIMVFIARNAEPSLARSALVSGFISTCSILAILGVFELVTGRAKSGILLAVLIEVTLALAYLFVEHA